MYRGKIIACITNRRLVEGDFLAQIERVAAMEMVDWIIVREKDLRFEEYRQLFVQVARIAHGERRAGGSQAARALCSSSAHRRIPPPK